MKEKKYLISPLHFIVSAFTAVALFVLAVIAISLHNYVASVICAAIAVFFVHEAYVYGRIVEIDDNGARTRFIGHIEKDWRWNEVAQVGVAGTRVFMKDFLGRTGSLFIYFSKEELDDQQIFDMMLDWPTKDRIFLKYDIDRLNVVQTHYSGRIKKYNAGDLKIYDGET